MVVEMMLVPLQFGVPGGMELAVILLIAVLLFGANKIPKLARSTGQAMGEFQRGRTEIEQELEDMKEPPKVDADEDDEPAPASTATTTEESDAGASADTDEAK